MKTITASTSALVALDLGKYKRVACIYDGDPATAGFQTLSTSRAELVRWLQQHPGVTVVLEACALAGWVHDLCAELGLPATSPTPPPCRCASGPPPGCAAATAATPGRLWPHRGPLCRRLASRN